MYNIRILWIIFYLVVELKTEACSSSIDPGCDHICVLNPIYGPLCSCHFGYKLYEDSRACVLTKEYLEAEERELEEDFVIPVTIICLIGGLVIFIMAYITWYCLTRTQDHLVIVQQYWKNWKPTTLVNFGSILIKSDKRNNQKLHVRKWMKRKKKSDGKTSCIYK
jgi:hypothetical protein